MDEITFIKKQSISLAREFGWRQTYYKEEKQLIAFLNKGSRCHIEIYLRSKRVITCLEHPKKGTTVMERNGIGPAEMRKIFEDPRAHTFKGKTI